MIGIRRQSVPKKPSRGERLKMLIAEFEKAAAMATNPAPNFSTP